MKYWHIKSGKLVLPSGAKVDLSEKYEASLTKPTWNVFGGNVDYGDLCVPATREDFLTYIANLANKNGIYELADMNSNPVEMAFEYGIIRKYAFPTDHQVVKERLFLLKALWADTYLNKLAKDDEVIAMSDDDLKGIGQVIYWFSQENTQRMIRSFNAFIKQWHLSEHMASKLENTSLHNIFVKIWQFYNEYALTGGA